MYTHFCISFKAHSRFGRAKFRQLFISTPDLPNVDECHFSVV
uniref:Uncharacterized protein n=1 Tax=Romanomermis culicivorax TaxID=13658 RepID=A0A915J6M3_ROMCU